jgi:hypothetical protein
MTFKTKVSYMWPTLNLAKSYTTKIVCVMGVKLMSTYLRKVYVMYVIHKTYILCWHLNLK